MVLSQAMSNRVNERLWNIERGGVASVCCAEREDEASVVLLWKMVLAADCVSRPHISLVVQGRRLDAR